MAKIDKSRQKEALSIEQLNAIDLLIMGKCDREVAEAVGVSRQTVTGWRLYNPYFQAELNRRRKEVWGTAVDKFRSLLLDALETVEKAIKQGDAKTALEVLRMAGMDMTKDGSTLGNYLVGEDDPDRILAKEAKERQRKGQKQGGIVAGRSRPKQEDNPNSFPQKIEESYVREAVGEMKHKKKQADNKGC